MNAHLDDEHRADPAEACITVTAVRLRPGVVVVEVTGDLDATTTATFHHCLSEILDSHHDQPVELDLSALQFCDLAGLRALHAWDQAVDGAQRQVRITAAGPGLDLLLRLCHIPGVLGYPPAADTAGG
jgi:anti-anti-sigma factor